MVLNATQLLKNLQPAVLPAGAPFGGSKPQAALESQSFDQLLSMAARGTVHSGRQVELGLEPTPPLSASQLERLASAADQAEAAGAKHALMLIDGRGFVLDVANRKLTAELSNASGAAVQGVDAALFVPNDHDALLGELLKPPGSGVIPSAVAKQIVAAQQKQSSQQNASSPKRAQAA